MRFTKMHGAGNDYIYVNCFEEQVEDAPSLAKKLSDRHFGVGGDGLVLICPSSIADVRMEMYNADGSRGAMCGNAARCVARYCYERGLVRKDSILLETDAGLKPISLQVENNRVLSVCVDMGAPLLMRERAHANVLGMDLTLTRVSMGNPHAVALIDTPVDSLDIQVLGDAVDAALQIEGGVNVEFVNVLAPGKLRMRVRERGSGVTLACGTGACATLAAAIDLGCASREAELLLDGGTLRCRLDDAGHIQMQGPAQFVFDGELSAN